MVGRHAADLDLSILAGSGSEHDLGTGQGRNLDVVAVLDGVLVDPRAVTQKGSLAPVLRVQLPDLGLGLLRRAHWYPAEEPGFSGRSSRRPRQFGSPLERERVRLSPWTEGRIRLRGPTLRGKRLSRLIGAISQDRSCVSADFHFGWNRTVTVCLLPVGLTIDTAVSSPFTLLP